MPNTIASLELTLKNAWIYKSNIAVSRIQFTTRMNLLNPEICPQSPRRWSPPVTNIEHFQSPHGPVSARPFAVIPHHSIGEYEDSSTNRINDTEKKHQQELDRNSKRKKITMLSRFKIQFSQSSAKEPGAANHIPYN
jgi:hypothetical protein